MAEEMLPASQKARVTRAINQFKADSKNLLEDFKSERDEVLSPDEEGKTIVDQFRDAEASLASLYDSIFDEHSDTGESLADMIEDFVPKFEEMREGIESELEEIQDYNVLLNGTEDEDGNLSGGIRDKIQKRQEEFDKLYKLNKTKQEKLFGQIESLLKGASTVALASAYHKHKNAFNTPNGIWMAVFVLSIVSMMAVSIWTFTSVDYDISEMWKMVLGNLPFIAGAVWLAIYATKQRSQNKRLQEEYAHKEDVAKIYYALNKELGKLRDEGIGEELSSKLIEVVINTVAINPSETLDSKSHDDKGPVLEVLKDIKGQIKIPGA